MKYSLGFSPCPNDTFIFDALVNHKIGHEGFDFAPVLEDINTLNIYAAEGKLDVSKLSFPTYFQQLPSYRMLDAGSALGKGVGPLLVAKTMVPIPRLFHSRIAIPGEQTTANFLLDFAFPGLQNKISMLFSEIEDAILDGRADLGVIIHENRFTYQKKGLIKICDLGEMWEERQQAPIPLACIAAKNSIPAEVQEKISSLIRQSVEFAFSHYPEVPEYTRQHSQAMDEDVMRQHIQLYVNDYSIQIGEKGRKAVEVLYEVWKKLKM